MKSTTRPKFNKIIITVSVLLFIIFLAVVGWRLSEANLVGLKPPKYDEVLSPKVSAYLASRASGIYHSGTYDSYGNLLHGPSENYCDAEIYGHDENYIYALATCHEYSWFYHYRSALDDEDTIIITREVSRGTSWSSHVRLRYSPGTDFEITGYDQPREGSLYHDDLMRMFAPVLTPLGDTTYGPSNTNVSQELREKFRSEHGNDPYPEKIDRVYASRNPKIIIGGEVED